jgi:hypothetical protein
MSNSKITEATTQEILTTQKANPVPHQSGGISVENLVGLLHLNLTQPECTDTNG